MLSIVNSCNLIGIDGFIVNVEVDITRGMPCFNIVGLASVEIKEAKERVKSAIINSNFEFPTKRIVVNLSPADIKKEGSLLDLPISIGLLMNYIKRDKSYFNETIFVGELSLDGTLKKVRGILPIVLSAKQKGYKRIFIPFSNIRESSYVDGIEIIPIKNLRECINYINNEIKLDLNKILIDTNTNIEEKYKEDFSDVRGNFFVKRGLEIAAAGNHNVILTGPPGCGKTMMARRIKTIMPDLDREEMMEISKIYSIAGLINNNIGIINKRPFRAPHHSATNISLLGGGAKAIPGEIVLAHRGVLFLDELAEFDRKTLDMLRQPIEDGSISLSRLKFYVKYPCNILIVAAMNPCPCGYFMSKTECKCSAHDIMRYKNKISGPLLDRFDIFLDVDVVGYDEFKEDTFNETSEMIKSRVQQAKKIQQKRFEGSDIKNNDEIKSYQINQYCKLDKDGQKITEKIFNKYKLSNRSYTKLLKTARTIADLELCEEINKNHILEAFSYRKGYYKYFK
ncbi:YifB family Mg chelatase-like AAA ATPase [Intestinibacter sp.]